MITLKRLNQCTLDEAVRGYNRGFEGYFFDQSKTADSLAHKLGKEELSPVHSLVAFHGQEPIGIVLSGIWNRKGKRIAWNGGTGVAPEYRKQGVGQRLMEETLQIYREQGVDLAALVAIKENSKAISLYERLGFQVVGQSIFLESQEWPASRFSKANLPYRGEHGIPQDVYRLPFWTEPIWDVQWNTIENREALLIRDEEEQVIGYALYRRIYGDNGELATVLLFDAGAHPERGDADDIIQYALEGVYASRDTDNASYHRLTVNLPVTNQRVISALERAAFTRMAEQVFMTLDMKK